MALDLKFLNAVAAVQLGRQLSERERQLVIDGIANGDKVPRRLQRYLIEGLPKHGRGRRRHPKSITRGWKRFCREQCGIAIIQKYMKKTEGDEFEEADELKKPLPFEEALQKAAQEVQLTEDTLRNVWRVYRYRR